MHRNIKSLTKSEKRFRNNENAQINIDLIFAMILFFGAIFAAYQIVPTLSNEDRYRVIEQYTMAVRVSDNLVNDQGDDQWWIKWNNTNNKADYINVTKVGLTVGKGEENQKILDNQKIIIFFNESGNISNNIPLWDYPNNNTSVLEKQNATRVLGLKGYNFYMQLYPVNYTYYNLDMVPLTTMLNNRNINFNTATEIERVVFIYNSTSGERIKNNGIDIAYRLNLWIW